MDRRKLLANLGAVSCFALPYQAQAQYLNKPVRLILHFPAGGLADAVCRVLSIPLAQQLGQPVLVEKLHPQNYPRLGLIAPFPLRSLPVSTL